MVDKYQLDSGLLFDIINFDGVEVTLHVYRRTKDNEKIYLKHNDLLFSGRKLPPVKRNCLCPPAAE